MFRKLLFTTIFISFLISGDGILFLNVPNSGRRLEKNKNSDYSTSFIEMGLIPLKNLFQKPKKVQFRPQDLYYRSAKAVYSPSMSSFCILYPDSCNNAEGW